MAANMAFAAAVGFLGAKATSTSFVVSPVAQQPSTSRALASTGYQPNAQPAAGTSTTALCAGLSLGFAGAAAASSSVQSRPRKTKTAAYDPTSALGALQPMGYWDPCGLMKERVGKDGWQWKDEKTFEQYRIAELKHGRVAMLAAVGMVTTTVWKFPGFEDIPDGFAALNTSMGGSGFGLIFLLASYFEITNPKGDFQVPGPWGATDELRTKEIANGRLAMAGVVTLLITEYGDKLTPAQQFAETLSNLQGSAGFATAWAIFVLGFAWTQQAGVDEIAWSSKNFLYSKGLGEKPSDLKAATITVSATLPEASAKASEEKKIEEVVEATA